MWMILLEKNLFLILKLSLEVVGVDKVAVASKQDLSSSMKSFSSPDHKVHI